MNAAAPAPHALPADVQPGAGIDVPVYVNPAALDTVQGLRAALERTNLQLAQQFNKAQVQQGWLVALAEDIAPVVMAQMAGDADALDLALLRLIKRHVRVMAPTPPPPAAGAGGMH